MRVGWGGEEEGEERAEAVGREEDEENEGKEVWVEEVDGLLS